MALAYVAERGKLDIINGSGSSQAVTLSATCGAGNLIVLLFGTRTAATLNSITDSRGNTWSIDRAPTTTNAVWIVSTVQNGGALQSGDTITLTFSATPGNTRMAVVEEFSGNETASYVDQSAGTTTASGTSHPSGTTGTTAQADEVAVVAWTGNGNVFAGSLNNSYQQFTTFVIDNAGAPADTFAKTLSLGYKILSGTGTQDCTATFGATTSSEGAIVTYKAAAAGGTPPTLRIAQSNLRW